MLSLFQFIILMSTFTKKVYVTLLVSNRTLHKFGYKNMQIPITRLFSVQQLEMCKQAIQISLNAEQDMLKPQTVQLILVYLVMSFSLMLLFCLRLCVIWCFRHMTQIQDSCVIMFIAVAFDNLLTCFFSSILLFFI